MKQLPRNDDGTLASWAWPGGYPIYYLDGNSQVLCPKCANKADKDPDEWDDWKAQAAGINYEDSALYCDNCSERIESAYAEDETDDAEALDSYGPVGESICDDGTIAIYPMETKEND